MYLGFLPIWEQDGLLFLFFFDWKKAAKIHKGKDQSQFLFVGSLVGTLPGKAACCIPREFHSQKPASGFPSFGKLCLKGIFIPRNHLNTALFC